MTSGPGPAGRVHARCPPDSGPGVPGPGPFPSTGRWFAFGESACGRAEGARVVPGVPEIRAVPLSARGQGGVRASTYRVLRLWECAAENTVSPAAAEESECRELWGTKKTRKISKRADPPNARARECWPAGRRRPLTSATFPVATRESILPGHKRIPGFVWRGVVIIAALVVWLLMRECQGPKCRVLIRVAE